MTQPVQGTEGIKRFYDDPDVVASYLDKRIVQPLGAVLHRRQVAFLRRVIAQVGAGTVLDLAPGPARLSAEMEPAGLAVALDASFHMLRAARMRTRERGDRWRVVQADGYHLPLATASIDLVYSTRFIRRFALPEREVLYAEICRVLKPQGYFVMDAQNRAVALPHREARGKKTPVYDELYLRHELLDELHKNGFAVERLEGIMRRFPVQFRLNRLRRLRLGWLASLLIQALEGCGGQHPSTWMVLCRKHQA